MPISSGTRLEAFGAVVVTGLALATWVAPAGATEVVPAGDHYEATSDETLFIDANGNGNDIGCHTAGGVPASTAIGQVPPAGANNNNQLAMAP